MLTVTLHGPAFVKAVLRCVETSKQVEGLSGEGEILAIVERNMIAAKIFLANVILEELGIK